MKALQLASLDGPQSLALVDVDEPRHDDLVHIDVKAAGINFPDLLITQGAYQLHTEPPFVPGSEVAGVVTWSPPGSDFAIGQNVVALVGTGGYAEKVAAHPGSVFPAPPGLDHVEAVTLSVNYQTAYFALRTRARLLEGETVLVLGAAGGIGTATIQVAKALGARVIAVVRRGRTDAYLSEVGANHVVALGDGWLQEVRDLTGGRGTDVVIDPIGGPTFDDAVRALAPGGRLVVVGFASGNGIPTVKVNRLLLRNVSVLGAGLGEHVRTRPEALHEITSALADLVVAGLRPPPSTSYPLSEGRTALEDLLAGKIRGKAVLIP